MSRYVRRALSASALALLSACLPSEPALPGPRTVLVESVTLAADLRRRFSGQLQAADRSELAFEAGGSIRAVHVELGDAFRAGAVLAELDDRAFALELSARQASLMDAEATLLDAGLDYERRASLKGTGAVSQSEIDHAKAALDRARAQVRARRADVDRSRKRLEDAKLIAPFDGEVVARLAEPSEVVANGATVLRIVGTESNLEAVVLVSGDARRALSAGQSAEIVLLAQAARVSGAITEIGAQANAAGLFPITVALGDHPQDARPGESVEAVFLAAGGDERMRIPLTAYVPTDSGRGTVFVVAPDVERSRIKAREVGLGALGDDGVRVLTGLTPGELIVTKGVELLADGEEVLVAGSGMDRYNR